MIEIKYTKSYDNSIKKLRRYNKEKENLTKIIEFIERNDTFIQLTLHPFAKMYGFERLKHDKNEFYSFNLSKNGGVIRLIVLPQTDNSIYLVYISFDHYKDFTKEKVIYYDE